MAHAVRWLRYGSTRPFCACPAKCSTDDILADADQTIFGQTAPFDAPEQVVRAMLPYIAAHVAQGGRLHHITRHMLGLFAGRPGARVWKHRLSTGAHNDNAGVSVVEKALESVVKRAA